MLLFVLFVVGAATFMALPRAKAFNFPEGRRFAFSIIDDTDSATLDGIEPVYQVLHKYGLRTTKTVWALESNNASYPPNEGDTLQDAAYKAFILDLRDKGFEIALHGVRGGSSTRADIIAGLEQYRDVIGEYPKMHVNHSFNQDNLYWGPHRWSFPPYRWLYAAVRAREFSGHDPESPYFWGDIAQQRVKYVNQFTVGGANVHKFHQAVPYRLADKPFVNYWFPTADGDGIERFVELLSPSNLDALEREGGVCLVYVHLGTGNFYKDGQVDPRFEARIQDLVSRNGWFAPASDILDHLLEHPEWDGNLNLLERALQETAIIWDIAWRGAF